MKLEIWNSDYLHPEEPLNIQAEFRIPFENIYPIFFIFERDILHYI